MEAMEREFGHSGLEHLSPALVGRVTQIATLLRGRQTNHLVIIH
jgi:hypothetical protein